MDWILSFIFDFIIDGINVLPSLDFSIPGSVSDTIVDVLKSALYFIPFATLLPLFLFEISLNVFHIVWSIVLRIKSFVPTMGN